MRVLVATILLVCACPIAACKATSRPEATPGEATPPDPPSEKQSTTAQVETARESRVVLVTIDGVRWQDVFGGGDPSLTADGQLDAYADPQILVPRLGELAAGGVAFGEGADGCGVVRTRGTSNYSLPGYLEMLGARATSCRSNACERTSAPSVLDEAARAGMAAASISSWGVLERAATDGSSDTFVSAGTHQSSPSTPATTSPALAALLEAGRRVAPFPGPAGSAYRPDAVTAGIALEYLRTVSPRLLHVGLGDTDEWAHRGNYVAYLRALHDADTFVGDVVDLLREQGTLDSTTVLVTTDHGRARDFRGHGSSHPEARRGFLFAHGPKIAELGARCPARDIELPDVGATIRRLLDLPPRDGSDEGRAIAEIAHD